MDFFWTLCQIVGLFVIVSAVALLIAMFFGLRISLEGPNDE